MNQSENKKNKEKQYVIVTAHPDYFILGAWDDLVWAAPIPTGDCMDDSENANFPGNLPTGD